MTSRNPFRIRSFQRTSGDDQFVRLFAPSALDVLEGTSDLWESLRYFRSAPGGGKTSLLRLMTPGPLRRIAKLADRDSRFKDTAARLQAIGALKDGQPAVLGIMLSFSNDYRDLGALDRRELQVFRALLTARIVLAALRAALEYSDKSFPDQLGVVRVAWAPTDGAKLPADADGVALKDWASAIEERAYDVLDSVRGDAADPSEAMIGFDGLNWLASAQFFVDGRRIDAQTVLLMDEAQELTHEQRTSLNEALTALRKPLGIWVAERLQALQADDLLAPGVRQGRDYGAEIRLEDTWRGKGAAPLRRFLGEIADLRIDQADDFQGARFFTFLAADNEDPKWQDKFAEHATTIEASVLAASKDSPRYTKWIEATRASRGTEAVRAVAWQTLKILVERDRDRTQSSFDFDPLPPQSLSEGATQAIQQAAELMLCTRIKAPYYFGPDRLAQLSSANVDQFLAAAGDLFDEIMAARLLRRSEHQLSAERQHQILKSAAELRWKEIPRGSARGHAVLRFLEGLASICVEETHRDTAPYAPGVTGIGIPMSDRDLIIGERAGRKTLQELREVLASCVAQNLLEPRLDHANKGQRWLVLYFNRLLCVHHDLPLGYGGWRPQKLQTLTKWLSGGNGSSSQEGRLV
jgi:hypothetical protein